MDFLQLEEKLFNQEVKDTINFQEEFKRHFENRTKIEVNNEKFLFFDTFRKYPEKDFVIQVQERFNGKIQHPAHVHNHVEMQYVYSGSCVQIIDNKRITLKKGDLIILDKNVPHSHETDDENDIVINILMRPKFFEESFLGNFSENELFGQFLSEFISLNQEHNHYMRFFTEGDLGIKQCIQNILCETFDFRDCSLNIIKNYIFILFSYISRRSEFDCNFTFKCKDHVIQVIDIIKYIEANYAEGSLVKMANEFGFNADYLGKVIKKVTGRSFKEWVHIQRLYKSVTLLTRTKKNIGDIALEIGYSNISYFYSKFTKMYGLSPQQYRELHSE
ncbi:MAG: AraC family transcriptional regulator [Clostridiaceae bacterium]